MSESTLVVRNADRQLSFDRPRFVDYLATCFGFRDLNPGSGDIELENDAFWLWVTQIPEAKGVTFELRALLEEGQVAAEVVLYGILRFLQNFDSTVELDVMVPGLDPDESFSTIFRRASTVEQLTWLSAKL